ncbi:hypothetical protein GCM10022261_21250 [Brevibacterium daeguense]|uniref:DUF5709 domain-containing protein n=1 Tax=Brevibacterium daeguense TaxID=909936 RepID=A0ABP8EKX7_9MICO|nr:hypothetical protein [Brevibacterium daeguense]
MTENSGDAFEEARAGVSDQELQAETSAAPLSQESEISTEQVEQWEDDQALAEPDSAIDPVPMDGRDGQAVVGGSDDPELIDASDPLKDPLRYSDETGELLAEIPTPDSPEGEEMR